MVRAIFFVAAAVALASATPQLPIKHLAGPPSTFALHRTPPTNDARIGENSCLVEIDLTPLTVDASASVTAELVADSESQFVFSLLTPFEAFLELTLQDPNGVVVSLADRSLPGIFPTSVSSTFSESMNTTVYSFFDDDIVHGIWKLTLALKAGAPKITNTAVRVLVFNEAAVGGVSRLASYKSQVGGRVAFQAWLGAGSKPLAHAVSKARRVPLAQDVSWEKTIPTVPLTTAEGSVTSAQVIITLPSGAAKTVVMRDDGLEDDLVAGDNIFTGGVVATQPGIYTSVVQLEGRDAAGRLLRRTVQQMMAAVEDPVALNGTAIVRHQTTADLVTTTPTAKAVSSGAAALHLDIVATQLLVENADVVEVLISIADAVAPKYRVYTELYQEAGTAAEAAVAWFGGMTIPVEVTSSGVAAGTALPVQMDGTWLQGTKAPYSLKNTAVYDVETGTVLATITGAMMLPASFGTAAASAAAATHRSIIAAYAAAGISHVTIAKSGVKNGALPASMTTTSPLNSVQARYGLVPASLYGGNFAPSVAGSQSVAADADVVAAWLIERPRTAGAIANAIRERDLRTVQGTHGTALTHGYCADSNVFTSTLAVWTHNPIFFEDYMQSRANDEFASKIHAFAAEKGLDSYSLVGHSQGGVVSTHLVNYYWTGADRATYRALATASPRAVSAYPAGHANGPALATVGDEPVPRSVQSIGTPYHGCTMAGTLAGFGSVFGVGCGTNFDLSLDGAKLWTVGIADVTRAQVYFATATYKLNSLFGDYCNVAVNSVLQWPNDGVTEITYAVLEGATDLGNTQKQCHTADMAYVAEWSDITRNTGFNVYTG